MTTRDTAVGAEPTDTAESTATPTWFGPPGRPLFGWIHVPARPEGRGVVLCPSIGLEGEASQFAFRSLAVELADAGCTVLRFDYPGTGDSAGLLSDPDQVGSWIDSIAAAIAYVRASGASQIHLVGARLGGVFATEAARRDGTIASLALWYPWSSGSQFLRYQRALRRLYATSDDVDTAEGSTEIPGFVLDAAVTADLKAMDGGGGGAPAIILAIEAADPETGTVLRPVAAADHTVRKAGTGAEELFGVELMRAAVDARDVGWIVESILATPRPAPQAAINALIRTTGELEAPGGGTVRERPVVFGARRLFGILTEPADGAVVSDRARVQTAGGTVPRFGSALFLNAGSLHHVGPGRQWVELSRRWAAAGVRCLRMDLGGVGESPLVGPPGILSSYPPTAVEDVSDGVRMLAPDDPGDVVLLGLCSGAFHSLLAAPSTQVGGVAVLNPLRLPSGLNQAPGSMGDLIEGYADPGAASADPGPVPARRRFLGSLRDSGKLKPISDHIPDRAWWLANTLTGASHPVAALERVVASGASLCVVLGPGEWPGIGRGRKHELRRVARSGVFSIALVPTLDHNFHVASGRREALTVLDEWVLGVGPGGRTTPPGVTYIG